MAFPKDFKGFCESEELDDETIEKLENLRFDSVRKLRTLREADIERLDLPVDQQRLLEDVVSMLKESQGQGGGASRGMPRDSAEERSGQGQGGGASRGMPRDSAEERSARGSRTREGRGFRLDRMPTDDASPSELRLVLFGKTGNGKSSTGNTILGREGFEEFFGQASGTTICQIQSVIINNRKISIVDTPGICDNFRNEADILFEVTRCLLFSAPGPHALLFVVNASTRFTVEEEQAYTKLKGLFASHLRNYLIIVFTHCEGLDNSKEKLKGMLDNYGKQIEKTRKERRQMPDIRKLMKDASNRHVIISNKTDEETKERQVQELLDTIQSMISLNPTEYFEDPKTKRATIERERLVQEIMDEKPGISREEAIALLPQKLKAISTKKALTSALITGIFGAAFTVATGGLGGVAIAAASAGSAVGGAGISKIIDTPGVCDTFRDNSTLLVGLSRCDLFSAPGVYVPLFVINAQRRFTEEEEKAYNMLNVKLTGCARRNLIIIFTHCEEINNSKKALGKMLESYRERVVRAQKERRQTPNLTKLLDDAANRYVIVSNKSDDQTKDKQIQELLSTIDCFNLRQNQLFRR